MTGPAKSEDGGCRQAFDKSPGGEMSPGRSGTIYAFPRNYRAPLMLGFHSTFWFYGFASTLRTAKTGNGL